MTDPMTAYLVALPKDLRGALHRNATVTALVDTATSKQHWTPQQLAAETSRDLDDARTAGAVMVDRLKKAAAHPPVGHARTTTFGPRLPFCSDDCRARAGWLEDDRGNPTGRCPCRTAPQGATA